MLNYTTTGTGKQPLVLLHGFMENTFIWEEIIPFLSKSFYLILIDLPGHGQSRTYGEIHTMEFMAEKVKEVLDHLGLQKVHILGHSMGGYVSLAFAEKYLNSLTSLTLFFSSFLEDTEEKKDQRRKSFRIIIENFKTYVSSGIPNFFSVNERHLLENQIEFAKQVAHSTKPEGALSCMKGMIERTDKTNLLSQLNIPILILAGQHDNAIKTETITKHIPDLPNIKTYILDCGHNGQLEKPEICGTIIKYELSRSFN